MNEKCVIIIDENTPAGVAANTAAILGITLGIKVPNVIGADVFDSKGNLHAGIIRFPIPILKCSSEILKDLRLKLYEANCKELFSADFTDIAQNCKTYDEYIDKMAYAEYFNYIGIIICGDKNKINKLTGNLSLF